MNTPEQRSIVSRATVTLKRIPDQVGHFVMHSSGDFDWEGGAEQNRLARQGKYHPRTVLGALLEGLYKVVDKIIPPLVLAAAFGGSSYALTTNTGLPIIIRAGLGAAVGLGLAYVAKSSGPEEWTPRS